MFPRNLEIWFFACVSPRSLLPITRLDILDTSMASSVTPAATHTSIHSDFETTRFFLPDLVSDCHYPLRLNPDCYPVSRASEQWLLDGARLAEPKATAFMGLHAGELAAACYPDADAFHLRVCSDFLNWLFNMDDWLDEFDVDSTLGMRECCMSAFRDPINFQTEKHGGEMCKSYVGLLDYKVSL
jgi:hypothetical protein